MNTKNQVRTKTKIYITSESTGLCGVTVSLILTLIKEQSLEPVKTGQDNAKYYDADVLKQLRLHCAKSKPKRGRTNDA